MDYLANLVWRLIRQERSYLRAQSISVCHSVAETAVGSERGALTGRGPGRPDPRSANFTTASWFSARRYYTNPAICALESSKARARGKRGK